MGEMADFLQDCAELGWEDFQDDSYSSEPVACKYCGTFPLYWDRTSTGWRLVTEKWNLHTCKAYRDAKVRKEFSDA